MHAENAHKRTIQTYRRRVKAGSGQCFYHHEVHTLFEELIDKPWGIVRWHPAADVCETEDAFVIEIDLPGVAEKDVQVWAQGRILVVEGERNVERTEKGRCAHLGERPAGAFARTFHFVHPIEADKIEYRMQDGVLAVTVPKSQDKQEQQDEHDTKQTKHGF